MKRRNAECVKLRRTIGKRGKIDSLYGSTFIYVKFLMVWIMVLFADFILEFRFEYLWPFWLLLRSVYDSYKYQGLAFSVFFVCIALTSDMICFLFIPVHWLFFIASTYVWVQYVWHTDKGVCLPTISLWLLFLYIEASVRLKELKNLPFHMDLCRPFAAHCIGYPMVTLGFGFKSYVGFKVRQRKQKDVQKENDFYMQLLQQALPVEPIQQTTDSQQMQQQQSPITIVPITDKNSHSKLDEPVFNGNIPNGSPPLISAKNNNNNITKKQNIDKETKFSESDGKISEKSMKYQNGSIQHAELEFMEKRKGSSIESEEISEKEKNCKSSNPSPPKSNKWNPNSVGNKDNICNTQKDKKSKANKENVFVFTGKDEQILRLESDVKKLRNDLQSCRIVESELRSQVNSLIVEEKSARNELLLMRQDNDNLQSKLNSLLTSKQQDKQVISNLERKIQEEKKSKSIFESQLASERKAKRAEEAASQRAAALAAARTECTETCKARKRELENDLKLCRKEIRQSEDRKRFLEREVQNLLQYKESHKDTEILVSAISALQEKNSLLEESLSAENKVKLDLFSALGEAKRQLQISQSLIVAKDKEIEELKSKVTEVLAVMPSHPSPTPSLYNTVSARSSDLIYTSKLLSVATDSNPVVAISGSTLDPNASVYTPKNVMLTSDN